MASGQFSTQQHTNNLTASLSSMVDLVLVLPTLLVSFLSNKKVVFWEWFLHYGHFMGEKGLVSIERQSLCRYC